MGAIYQNARALRGDMKKIEGRFRFKFNLTTENIELVLEDRIFRIKTERSSATMPSTRTSHNLNNIEIEKIDGALCTVRYNWLTLSHRYKTDFTHFGMTRCVIDFSGEAPVIRNKYIVLKNDYIHQVIDVYHI